MSNIGYQKSRGSEMKTRITKIEKKVIITEVIFVIGIFAYLFFATNPSQIFPLHGMTIIEPDFNIEIENGEEVLISIDENFTNPIILKEDSEITLLPGIYYWKVRSRFRESEVQSFTIKTHVGLDIKKREENYELQNSGNVNLNVTKENEFGISSMTIDIGESEDVEKDNAEYEGREI